MLIYRYGEEEIIEKLKLKRAELLAAINDEAAKDRYAVSL